MQRSSILVFTTCYNERDNIGPLVDEIVRDLPAANILIIDDNSPDGTWDVILEKAKTYKQITAVKRPRKLGVGSAHKYALFFAMREDYDTLITMDADFSHDPKYLSELLRIHAKNTFVTGSRYCVGGTSDYKGYRNFVSRLGNVAARFALGVKLKELTRSIASSTSSRCAGCRYAASTQTATAMASNSSTILGKQASSCAKCQSTSPIARTAYPRSPGGKFW